MQILRGTSKLVRQAQRWSTGGRKMDMRSPLAWCRSANEAGTFNAGRRHCEGAARAFQVHFGIVEHRSKTFTR
jgi:hypothetical protein